MTVVFEGKIGTTGSLVVAGLVVTWLNLASSDLESRLPLKFVGEEPARQQNEIVSTAMSQQPDTSVVDANLSEVMPP